MPKTKKHNLTIWYYARYNILLLTNSGETLWLYSDYFFTLTLKIRFVRFKYLIIDQISIVDIKHIFLIPGDNKII